MLRKWLITTLRNRLGAKGDVHAPFYVAGDGVAYTRAGEVLKSTAVKNQLDDVRKLRELALGAEREKARA